jgi:hypothetical protein
MRNILALAGIAGVLVFPAPAVARYYAAETARFLEPDPIGMGDGPNLYSYVRDRPTAVRDPTGLMAVEARASCSRQAVWLNTELLLTRLAAEDIDTSDVKFLIETAGRPGLLQTYHWSAAGALVDSIEVDCVCQGVIDDISGTKGARGAVPRLAQGPAVYINVMNWNPGPWHMAPTIFHEAVHLTLNRFWVQQKLPVGLLLSEARSELVRTPLAFEEMVAYSLEYMEFPEARTIP